MFSLTRPSAAEIERQIAAARLIASDGPGLLSLHPDAPTVQPPSGFQRDRSRSLLGQGEAAFESAKHAFRHWVQFDLGWVRVAHPDGAITTGLVIAVEIQTLHLWTLNLSRIVATIDSASAFGFIYSTTSMHVERGEELFLIRYDHQTGQVWYELEAFSRPRHPLARAGFPIARAFQRRFVRESHRRMKVPLP